MPSSKSIHISQANAINSQLLNAVREIIQQARSKIQQTVNSAMVHTYWQIGCLIVEHEQKGEMRASYGQQQLERLVENLTREFGKGFNISSLRKMRAFYVAFPIQAALRPELSWTHYRKLIPLENEKARQWYMQEAIDQAWSARALERQINVLYYERLLSSQDKAAVQKEAEEKTESLKPTTKEYLRDPYVLDFLNLPSTRYLESDLEQGIIDNLQNFLLELGKGFAFVARQQRIVTEDQDFYIDLVFYNFKLKCFLLIDLKLDKLTHQDVGQMDSYIRIYDQHKKSPDDNPTMLLFILFCYRK